MSSVDTTLSEFGRLMGLPGLAFNDNGMIRLRFESAGTLTIERTPRGTLLRLARPLRDASNRALEQAMALCHFSGLDRHRVDVGMAVDGSLVFWLCLADEDMQLSGLEEAFGLLRRLHDRVGE